MDTDMDGCLDPRPAGRTVGAAEAVALGGFVAFLVVPWPARIAAAVVMAAGALGAVGLAAAWMCRGRGSPTLGILTIVSSLGLVGSVAYLSSLADEPAAIPVGGTLALLLSLVGLLVTGLRLRRR
jgi:hypothetical protein